MNVKEAFASAKEHEPPLPPGIFSAAELQGRVFPPIKWIVPDILPEGLTLLAGKPKLGKSWLALDAAIAVASDDWLGPGLHGWIQGFGR